MPYRNENIKLVLVGDTNVGKSSIVNRYIHNNYTYTSETTIGASYYSKIFNFKYNPTTVLIDESGSDTLKLNVNIWDTAGQEKYNALVSLYYKHANILFYVFDITEDNFKINQEIIKSLCDNTEVIVIFNKRDLVNSIKLKNNVSQLISRCNCEGWKYYIVSAKNGENINELFNSTISEYVSKNLTLILNKHNENKIKFKLEDDKSFFNCC
jgi:small GTP-binding protein